jgi:hypothetical protein
MKGLVSPERAAVLATTKAADGLSKSIALDTVLMWHMPVRWLADVLEQRDAQWRAALEQVVRESEES